MATFSRELRYFEHAARTMSVRAASSTLHIAPSAVSRAVQQLEHELGVQLFDRTIRGLHLTAAGEIVLAYAQRWEKEDQQLIDALRSISGSQRHVIRVATIEAASYDLIPQVWTEVRTRVRGLQLDLQVADTSFVMESVINGSVEIGLTINLPKKVAVENLWTVRNPVGVVLPPDHRLARRKTVSFSDCLSAPIVLPAEGLAARSAIRIALDASGQFEVAATSNRITAIKSLVRKGLAVSFLTRMDVAAEDASGELKFLELEDKGIEHPYISIIVARAAKPSAVADIFIAALRNMMPMGNLPSRSARTPRRSR